MEPTTHGPIIRLRVVLTLVTWVQQNRQGWLHPSLWERSAPPSFNRKAFQLGLSGLWSCKVFFYCQPKWPTTQGPNIHLRVVLTLVTWVPQNRQGCSTPHSGGALQPLRSTGKHFTKVNRAFGPARSFSLVNPKGQQLKAQLYSFELS